MSPSRTGTSRPRPGPNVQWRELVLLLAFFSAVLCAAAAQDIVSLRQLKQLDPAQAEEGRPLRLHGTVVCYDAGWHQLYLHDGVESLYFNADDFPAGLVAGQSIEITGTARSTNSFANLNVAILGKSPLPTAKPLGLAELAGDHGEWIEIRGRILSAETSRGRLALLLHDRGQNCLVYVLGSPPAGDFKRLLNCQVRLRGINATRTANGRIESPMVFVPGIAEVTVLQSSAVEPERAPVVSVGSLLNRELGSWTNRWVHVNGLVVSYQPGQSVVVKDPTGVIRARVIQLTAILGDERVDLWGFLEVTPDETYLNNAYFEPVQPQAESPASSAKSPSLVAGGKPSELITRMSEVRKLRREEAARHLPVQLRGVLTYADVAWRNAFLQDENDALYLDLDPGQIDLHSGQWVTVTGETSPGGFAPEVIHARVEVVGVTNLPSPARVGLRDLANGHLDAHWLEMEGFVRRADQQSGHVTLSLMTPEGRFKALLPGFEDQPAPTQLIDALVSVHGACVSELNSLHQLSGITLRVPNLEAIKVLEPAPTDPFAIGTTPIAAVATFDPARLAGRRIKVQGVVTLRMPGQGFILQDISGGLRVFTRQPDEVALGDIVDVLGFPAIGGFSPELEEGAFRRTGARATPLRQRVTADQVLLRGTNDAQLVELDARLLQSVPRSANPQLVLQDGPIIFTAHLESAARRLEVPALQSGTRLRLAGVCSIQGGERHEPIAFRLLLRSPDDISVLQKAPWWTTRNAFLLAGGMMFAVALALGWVASLRRQVQTQTELVRQKLQNEAALEERYRDLFENANDMVYTHDLTGRITSVNQTGERLLQRPRRELLGCDLLDLVVEEERPAARRWLRGVLKGAAWQTVEWDFLSASGQRVKLEISTRLIERAGTVVEVEGIARDITERKRLEREILEISNREQRRIGHDLHDGVCQQLAGIAFMTSTLADELDERRVPQAAEVEKISHLLNDVIDQTRGVARGLFPVRLEEKGLVAALEDLAANASDLFKLDCRVLAESPLAAVDNGIALHLYYIVLEAVANAAKHGGARVVTIKLESAGEHYRLSIEDDGSGFAPAAGTQSGMGIRIMQYRARVIGASLDLQSRPGSGTAVACLFLPVSRETLPGHSHPAGQGNGKSELNPAG